MIRDTCTTSPRTNRLDFANYHSAGMFRLSVPQNESPTGRRVLITAVEVATCIVAVVFWGKAAAT
jgi:hypothetical protein